MNPLDHTLITWYTRLSGWSPDLDRFIGVVSNNDLVKGGAIVALIWGLWFLPGEPAERTDRRAILLATLVGAVGAVLLARLASHLVPFRLRPLYVGDGAFRFPFGPDYDQVLVHRSSFPSDHAALFAALVTGIITISRRIGLLAALYAAVLVVFPRLYLGFHYPTDALAGMLIGVTSTGMAVVLGRKGAGVRRLITGVLGWEQRFAGLFYVGLFVFTFEVAELFTSSRLLAMFVWHEIPR